MGSTGFIISTIKVLKYIYLCQEESDDCDSWKLDQNKHRDQYLIAKFSCTKYFYACSIFYIIQRYKLQEYVEKLHITQS